MAKTKANSQTAPLGEPSWWLQEGDEECAHCGQFYIYELEFRCPQCDEASCLHCRRRASDGVFVCVHCETHTSAPVQESRLRGR